MAPMTISGSNPWLVVEKSMNAHEEISCTWEFEIIGKDARLLILMIRSAEVELFQKNAILAVSEYLNYKSSFFHFLR